MFPWDKCETDKKVWALFTFEMSKEYNQEYARDKGSLKCMKHKNPNQLEGRLWDPSDSIIILKREEDTKKVEYKIEKNNKIQDKNSCQKDI
jgi:hypothetical protein